MLGLVLRLELKLIGFHFPIRLRKLIAKHLQGHRKIPLVEYCERGQSGKEKEYG
jgi:hypothetical protein